MAALEEIEDLGVEVINSLINSESEETNEVQPPTQKSPSPPREVVAIVEKKPEPVSGPPAKIEEDEEDDDEDFDETLYERLVGLTEMFPEGLRTGVSKLCSGSIGAVKGFYSLGRSAAWIFFSSSAILFAPVLFEVERAQMEEMQKQQQRQILLGPGAAVAGGAPGMAPAPPRH